MTWCSNIQSVVYVSSVEAEFIVVACANMAKEASRWVEGNHKGSYKTLLWQQGSYKHSQEPGPTW